MLLEEAVDSQLDRVDPLRRKPSPRKEKPYSRIHTRRIRRRIQTEVSQRDEAGCTFIGRNGRRCGARTFLEIDHGIAWAHGGSSRDASGLRLLCSAHNKHLARQRFGSKVPMRP